MIKNKSNYDDYFDYKNIHGIIFNLKNKEDYYESFSDLSFLESFKTIVIEYNNNGFLDDIIKDNIYDVLNYLRYIDDEYRDYRVNLVNEILVNLNSNYSKKDNLQFYAAEYYKRTDGNYIKFLLEYSKDPMLKQYILESMGYDIVVIYTHSEEIPDECFLEYIDRFIQDKLYINSLNAILFEYPELFSDEVFYRRSKMVLEAILPDKNKKLKLYEKKLIKYEHYLVKKINKVRRK